MQDKFLLSRVIANPQFNKRVPEHGKGKDYTPAERRWRWLMYASKYQCEDSLAFLASVLKLARDGSPARSHDIPITEANQLSFDTNDYCNITHCVFDVVLAGVHYIIDSTGVQHSPKWPLLSRYDDYKAWYLAQDLISGAVSWAETDSGWLADKLESIDNCTSSGCMVADLLPPECSVGDCLPSA
ncbi:hypothetical protein CC86DRAFT_410108 [Ophiobolus disseminans]|uniref:Uncharacterized protein n=1 Tax=Ophiobolus disseminans TaxID=1469910 RepID=A0A6A6ZPJ2_9PLEO|nr:hypothetical protein CC86DRAFT_410108 [Ophiobolus disseminans]